MNNEIGKIPYVRLSLEIIAFGSSDVITTSNPNPGAIDGVSWDEN